MGDTYPKRGDYEYIRKMTELTFYDPIMASKELVDELLYETDQRQDRCGQEILALAKGAIRNNLKRRGRSQIKQVDLSC